MRVRIYILCIVLFLLSSCTVHNVFKYADNEIIPVISTPDKHIISIIDPYKIGIDSVMNEVLCFSSIEMTKGKPQSLIGNFVTDLCLEMYDTIADICIMNNGGLRSSLPSGEITRGDIYKLMPFENELVVVELNAEEIYQLSKYIISRGGEPFSGCNIYSSADSMSIEMQNKYSDVIHKNSSDDIAISFVVCGDYTQLLKEEVNSCKVRVLTSDYLANGGDKMSFFNNKDQYKVELKVRDAIMKYCILKDTISSQLDNRFTILNE